LATCLVNITIQGRKKKFSIAWLAHLRYIPSPILRYEKNTPECSQKKKLLSITTAVIIPSRKNFIFFPFNTLHGMISPYIVKQSLLLPRLTPQMVTPSYPTAKNNIGHSLLATMYS